MERSYEQLSLSNENMREYILTLEENLSDIQEGYSNLQEKYYELKDKYDLMMYLFIALKKSNGDCWSVIEETSYLDCLGLEDEIEENNFNLEVDKFFSI